MTFKQTFVGPANSSRGRCKRRLPLHALGTLLAENQES
jgi:hypothetical protein